MRPELDISDKAGQRSRRRKSSRRRAWATGALGSFALASSFLACTGPAIEGFTAGGVSTDEEQPAEAGSFVSTPDAAQHVTLLDAGTDADARVQLSVTTFLAGVSLAGPEFNTDSLPGVLGRDYAFPTTAEVDAMLSTGMNVIRFPFAWERMQPVVGGPLDSYYMASYQALVTYASGRGAYVIIDVHSYARYGAGVIGAGDGGPTTSQFASFWGTLATWFSSNDKVLFGLMNEPHDMPTELWVSDANAAIAAIRATGARNLILVSGNGWDGAHDWTDGTYYGAPNGTALLAISDPLNNYAFEAHEYLDTGSTGRIAACGGLNGPQRLQPFTDWLIAHKQHGFLGEFAVSTDPTCVGLLEPLMAHLDQHRDVWMGWAWWSAGPIWGNYMFSLEPGSTGLARPQLPTLQQHL